MIMTRMEWGMKINKLIVSIIFFLIIFIIAETTYSIDLLGITWCNNDVVTFDPHTGTIKEVHGNLSCRGCFRGLAYDSKDEMLYALSQGDWNLYSINPKNFKINFVGKLNIDENVSWGEDIGGLTYDPVTDTLYTAVSHWNSYYTNIWSELVTIDKNTAEVSVIGYITQDFIGSLNYNPNDGLIYAYHDIGIWNPINPYLVTINPDDAHMTILFQMPHSVIMGLAKKPGGNIYYSWFNTDYGKFYGQVDLESETITLLGNSYLVDVASDAMIYKDLFVANAYEPVSFISIKPDVLNLKSKGKFITAYIQLTEDYYAEDIDISTVRIARATTYACIEEPIYSTGPFEIGDYNQDGVADVMVKFNRQKLINMLIAAHEELAIGDELEITITGELVDGMRFEGTDKIKLKYKLNNRLRN